MKQKNRNRKPQLDYSQLMLPISDPSEPTRSEASLEIRTGSALSEHEEKLLTLSGLKELGPTQAWTATGTNRQLAYSTHGLFRFFGKFPPPIAAHLISAYTNAHETTFDPMSGSGTTGVESLLLNRPCILNDINPFSKLLAEVKTTHIDKEILDRHLDSIVAQYEIPTSETFTLKSIRDPLHWFLPQTIDSLTRIRRSIENIIEEPIRHFFWICFASIIRRVSRATSQQGRLFLDVATAEENALPFFIKKSQASIQAVSSLPAHSIKPSILSFDLRGSLPGELVQCAELVICHPPYFNSYKYSSVNSLELAWLDYNYRDVSKNEVREFFKVGKESNAGTYINDMECVLRNLSGAMKHGATLALMIGDTVMHGNYIPVTRQLVERIRDIFSIELVVLRAPKYTEASWAASQRRKKDSVGIELNDFILILKARR